VFALWDRARLAEDSAVSDGGGWGGVTLAHNVRSPAEVDAIIDAARAAGAVIGREPGTTFWGGYSGVFIDPDGHPWEVAHNPGWELDADDQGSRPQVRSRRLQTPRPPRYARAWSAVSGFPEIVETSRCSDPSNSP
jgi:hypothetical protein